MNETLHIERTGQWKSDDVLFCVAQRSETASLLVGCSDFQVYEFDHAAENPERVEFSGAGHHSYVTGLTLAGDVLVSGGYDRRLVWWNAESREQIRAVDAHDKWIRRVMTTTNGERVLSIADDMRCRVWDAASGELVTEFSDHAGQTPHHYPSMLYAVAASRNGRWLATGDKVGHVAVWDASSFEKVGELECPVMYTWDPTKRRHSIGGIRSLSFSPDGAKLAVGGIGTIGNIDHLGGPARLEVFDWQTEERLFELEDEKHKGLIEQIAWTPDGARVLTAGGDHKGFLTIYDLSSGELLAQTGSDGHIHGFVADEALETIATVGHNRIETWSIGPEPVDAPKSADS